MAIAGAALAAPVAAAGRQRDPGGRHRPPPAELPGRGADRVVRRRAVAGSAGALVIAVRNTGNRALPNVAVTICNTTCSYRAPRGQGTTVQAFSYAIATRPTSPARHARSGSSPRRPARAATAAATSAPAQPSPPTPTPGRWPARARAHRAVRLDGDRRSRPAASWSPGRWRRRCRATTGRCSRRRPGPREAGRERLDQAASLRRAAQRQGHHQALISPRSSVAQMLIWPSTA